MAKRTLLQGGSVVTPQSTSRADVLIDGESIADILEPGTFSGEAEVRDVSDRLLLPGGVDVHTHMDSPSGPGHTTDTHETGTIAAAVGGTTTIIDFAAQTRGKTLLDAFEQWQAKASDKAAIDYSFHITVSDLYAGATDDMRLLVQSGVPSFKVYMAYKGAVMLDDGQLFEVLKASGRMGARVCIHAENGDVIDRIAADLVKEGKVGPRYHELARPPATEEEAVHRAIIIAELAEAPAYFVHMSTLGAVEAVRAAQDKSLPISGETCAHYLTLTPEVYQAPDFEAAKAVLTPPIRTQNHQDALWAGLTSGTIGIVSSDHCPLCFKTQKVIGREDFRDIPNGGPGVENRMIVLYSEGVASGRLSVQRYVEVTAERPAKEFGLFPRKGRLAPGADADIIVLDPAGSTQVSARTQYQNVDYSLWEGWTLKGAFESVYSRGHVVANQGTYVGRRGHGRFITRSSI